MPTHYKVRRLVSLEISTNFNGVFVELGSGWGVAACLFAKSHPLCTVIGYEISPIPFVIAITLKKLFRVKNIDFYRKNFYKIHLKQADIIYCYLFPKAMEVLKIKFENELKQEVLVISNTFRIPQWQVSKIQIASNLYQSPVYYYRSSC